MLWVLEEFKVWWGGSFSDDVLDDAEWAQARQDSVPGLVCEYFTAVPFSNSAR